MARNAYRIRTAAGVRYYWRLIGGRLMHPASADDVRAAVSFHGVRIVEVERCVKDCGATAVRRAGSAATT